MTSENEKGKWFHEIWFVVLMLFALGPFAFPLLWKSKKLSFGLKLTLTILFSVITVGAIWLSAETIKVILKYYQELQAAVLATNT